jgi:hypothetical protein
MDSVLRNFLDYQDQLLAKVSKRDEVLGLMFAGSAADTSRVDEHSDQDFFLIVVDGKAESFRQNLDWLPDHNQILLSPRETEHGLKVVYSNGRVLEFAIFEDSELDSHVAPIDNRVVLDKKDIAPRINKIAKKAAPKAVNVETEFELFLSLIQIGVGRFRRGEQIAADQHIKSYALEKLLGLIRELAPAASSKADSLNRFRRFEFDYPALGARIQSATRLDAETCAMELVAIATELQLAPIKIQAIQKILRWH